MRGVDTNVLVRYITDDHPEQSDRARILIQGAEDQGERLFVNHIVLCELCWTLRGGRYHYDRPTIAAVIEKMLETQIFVIEGRALVAKANQAYRLGRADFADYLVGLSNRGAGCTDTVSFDVGLKPLAEFTVL